MALAATVIVIQAALTSCGTASAGPKGPLRDYVAIGDSYTSGPGIEPIKDQGCLRSGSDYPALVAARLGARSFVDRSCGGATTKNLTSPQATRTGANPAQADALNKQTDLVTLGIGLNDGGLSWYLLQGCLGAVDGKAPAACETFLSQPDDVVEAGLSNLSHRIMDAVHTVQARAPHALVLLVGYPQIFPAHGSCPDRLPMAESDLGKLRRLSELIEQTYRTVAKKLHVGLVDMWQPSTGHDVCARDPWIRGAFVPEVEGPLHPVAAYHRAVADRIMQVLGRR